MPPACPFIVVRPEECERGRCRCQGSRPAGVAAIVTTSTARDRTEVARQARPALIYSCRSEARQRSLSLSLTDKSPLRDPWPGQDGGRARERASERQPPRRTTEHSHQRTRTQSSCRSEAGEAAASVVAAVASAVAAVASAVDEVVGEGDTAHRRAHRSGSRRWARLCMPSRARCSAPA